MPETRWLEPTADHAAMVAGRTRWARRVFTGLGGHRVRTSGRLPGTGGLLLMCNHASMLDTPIVCIAADRPIHWVATDTMFEGGVSALVCRSFGAIPKSRLRADARAIRLMRAWLRTGAVVGLFPEGERTWTGRTESFAAGAERLPALLGVPVVLGRLVNTYRLWPRWTDRPRRATVHVSFSEPRSFDRNDSRSDVLQWMTEGLAVDPRPDLEMVGSRLASGLENLLHVCPACARDETLVDTDGAAALACAACGAVFTIDDTHRLRSATDVVDLEVAVDRQRSTVEAAWAARVPDPVYESSPFTLLGPTGTLASGTLVLRPDVLTVERDGRRVWSVSLDEIRSVGVEYQRVLDVWTRDGWARGRIVSGSAWKWPPAVRYFAQRRA